MTNKPINLFEYDILHFNDSGLLLSERRDQESGSLESLGPQTVSFNKFCETYAFNEHRSRQLDKLKLWIIDLHDKGINILSIWFGGSFTELKEKPSDIDLLLIYQPTSESKEILTCLNKKAVQHEYGIDLYSINLADNPANIIHSIGLYTLYFSHPSSVKAGSKEAFERKAVISVLGSELSALRS